MNYKNDAYVNRLEMQRDDALADLHQCQLTLQECQDLLRIYKHDLQAAQMVSADMREQVRRMHGLPPKGMDPVYEGQRKQVSDAMRTVNKIREVSIGQVNNIMRLKTRLIRVKFERDLLRQFLIEHNLPDPTKEARARPKQLPYTGDWLK